MYFCLLLLAVLGSPAHAGPVGEAEKHRVIVVGAGVSGFTAAATLLEHDVTDLLVLEAADRIGGRVNTVEFGGVSIDRGAEFVHGEKDNAVFELANPHDLLTSYAPMMLPDKFIFTNTSEYIFDSFYVEGLIDKTYAIFHEEEMIHSNGSLDDYFHPRLTAVLESNNVDPELGEALRHLGPLLEGVMSAAQLPELGLSNSYDYEVAEGDQQLQWKTGGYNTIFNLVSKKFPNPEKELPVVNKTLFGKQVTRIERREGDVEVTCADGSSYIADHVIVTLSLGVLKKHAATMFHPALSADKTAAIESLGMGCVAKVFMLFPTRWWPSDKTFIMPLFSQQELQDYLNNTKHGSWTAYTTGFTPVINHDRMLRVWFSGPTCLTVESLPEEQVVDGLMELLHKLLGHKYVIPRPEKIMRCGWGTYPYTLGSYSYRSVDSDLRNITNNDLAEPVMEGDKPVILFAGEATHSKYWTTVHGALSTGRREANNLLSYLKKQ